MSFNKRFFTTGGIVASSGVAGCTTDSADVFGDASGVALYTMDYDASDASGSYDGVPTNVEFGVAGQINYGAGFNGSSSEIDLPVGIGASGDRTRSLWINVSAFPASGGDVIYYIGQQGVNDDYEYLNVRSDGTIRYQERHDSGGAGDLLIDSQTTISLNQWYNIVIVFDGLNRSMYINGSTALGNTGTKSTQTVDNSAYAGNLGSFRGLAGTATYDGKIDQFRVFNRALTTDEVSTLYGETACVYTCTTDTVDYPTTNLAYYKLDNSVEDETGTYDGTPTNINYTFGRFGQAAVFNGSNAYINLGTSIATSTRGVSIWVNADNFSERWAFQQGDGQGIENYIRFYNTDDIQVRWGNVTQTFSGYSANTWIHIFAQKDENDNANVWINGVEMGSTGTPSAITVNKTYLGVRNNGGTLQYYFDGKIDQVRIFSSALTSTQVESLYNEKPCEDTSTFKTVLYEGNDTGSNTISQLISNVGFQPDLVWIKNRQHTNNHVLMDSVRGDNLILHSNTTDAQASAFGGTLAIEATGFTTGKGDETNKGLAGYNDYVAWVWKAGGDAVTIAANTVGNTIASDVSANVDAGFSIVRFDPNFTASGQSGTVGHGLNQAPEIIITKSLDLALNWWTSIDGITGTQDDYVALNTSTEVDNLGSSSPFGRATNTVFSVSWTFTDTSNDFIAYCFHSVAGVSDIGSYTGNTTSGVTVTTGFEPSWVMIKRTDSANDWVILDNQRDPINPNDKILWADLSDVEANGSPNTEVNFTSTGFSISNTVIGGSINANGGTYIYMAFK